MPKVKNRFMGHAQVSLPLICGAMYPCSNPELVAAVSAAGGMGIIQPVSMVYAHGIPLDQGIEAIQALTANPVGFNAIVERSSPSYEKRMGGWIDTALERGIRFFVTALGNPAWVVKRVHGAGGKVYHDVTELRWALKAVEAGVDGLICVNSQAGGHAGSRTREALFEELAHLDLPLVCAGGIGRPEEFASALDLGYSAVQMGTRFIASRECSAHGDYKQAILDAEEADIVLTDRISGVPVSVIQTPFIQRTGTRAGWLARRLLRHPRYKHYVRMAYTLKSVWQLRNASLRGSGYKDFFQAGKSVGGIGRIEPVADIVHSFSQSLQK